MRMHLRAHPVHTREHVVVRLRTGIVACCSRRPEGDAYNIYAFNGNTQLVNKSSDIHSSDIHVLCQARHARVKDSFRVEAAKAYAIGCHCRETREGQDLDQQMLTQLLHRVPHATTPQDTSFRSFEGSVLLSEPPYILT